MRKTIREVIQNVRAKTARHKNNSYHNKAYLLPDCKRDFNNCKKWEARGLWPSIVYCSKACQKKHRSLQ